MSATEDRHRLSCAETAKLVRKALKAEFPRTRFSVRSKTYSMGASIDVGWTDGPTGSQVDAVLSLYSGASFDGMTDMKSYHDSMLMTDNGPQVVHFGADFVHGQRRISNEWRTALEAEIASFAGQPYEPNARLEVSGRGGSLARDSQGEWASQVVWQLTAGRTHYGTTCKGSGHASASTKQDYCPECGWWGPIVSGKQAAHNA